MSSSAASAAGRVSSALRFALIALTVVVLLLMLNGSLYLAAHYLDPAREVVDHTRDVLASLSSTLLSLTDAESYQRNYMITGDRAYLDGYERGRRAALAHLSRLRSLTADNPAQQAQAARLRRVLDDKFAFMAALTAERPRGDAARYDLARGHRLLMQARAIIDAMAGEEARLLRARDGELTRCIRLIQYGIGAILVEQVTLLGTMLVAFARAPRPSPAA